MDELEDAIDQALEGNPRAAEIDEMIGALRLRMASMERDLAASRDPAALRTCEHKLREVRKQIEALQRERAVSEFVELSVRGIAARPQRELEIDPNA